MASAISWIFFDETKFVVVEMSSPADQPWLHPGPVQIELPRDASDSKLVAAIRRTWAASNRDSGLSKQSQVYEAYESVGAKFGIKTSIEALSTFLDPLKCVKGVEQELKHRIVVAPTRSTGGDGRLDKEPVTRLPLKASDEDIVAAVRQAIYFTT